MGLKAFLSLNLSESQEAEIMKILDRHEGEMEALRERGFQARQDLRKALRAEPLNEDGLRQAFRAVSSVREEQLVLKVRMREDLNKILSPAQRDLLKEKRGQGPQGFRGRPDK